ncbi:MAG: flagellar motor switch protein FliM [Gammaproteobacteria bacterium]
MSSNDLLSQDEIDALLNGVGLSELEPEMGNPPSAGEVVLYDFSSQDRVVPARMPALDVINERFARSLHAAMSEVFCSTLEISVNGVQMLKFAEFVQDLRVPTSLNLVSMKPLPGTALFALDPMLVFRTVECLFGGDGRCPPRIEAREFTPMEQEVIQQVLEHAFHSLQHAWSPVLALAPAWLSAEPGPDFDNVFDAAEAMVVAGFTVSFRGGSGELRIAMPYAMLEPVLDSLGGSIAGGRGNDDYGWQNAMGEQIRDADVQVSSALAETAVSLRQLATLQVGDVIPIEIPAQVLLCAERTPLFWGEVGIHRGRYAVKIGGSCAVPLAKSGAIK